MFWDKDQSRFEMWVTADTDSERAILPCPGDEAVGFYHATSSDGTTWKAEYDARDFEWDSAFPAEIPDSLAEAGYPVVWAINQAVRQR